MEQASEKKLLKHFAHRRPVVLIILDGWGLGHGNNGDEGDAVFNAKTTTTDSLTQQYPHTTLLTHGHQVGLPNPRDMGGSEVGHITLGAGKIVEQGAAQIKRLLAEGRLFETTAAKKLLGNCLKNKSALHLLGLLSDGNVHSHIDHFMALIDEAARLGITKLYVHALLDGRDVPYQSATEYVTMLEEKLARVSRGKDWDYAIASGGGRERITMDRDRIWARVELGWQTHVQGKATVRVNTANDAILAARQARPDLIDQDLPPFVVVRDGHAIAPMQDGDSVIYMNFRSDRALEFSQAMLLEDFTGFERGRRPQVVFGSLATYDQDQQLPPLTLVPSVRVKNPLGDRLSQLGLRQFRLAETQKFPHVTFFFNGGRKKETALETYACLPSDKITSFAQAPAMQAYQVAKKATAFITSGQYQFGLINFANPDMVGHTGDIPAVKRAVQATDEALGQVLNAVRQAGGSALVTADHGNADEMIVLNPRTQQKEPSTKHSLNPVPLWIFDPQPDRPYQLKTCHPEQPNTLANIAASIFVMLGEPPPNDLYPHLFIHT